MIIKTNPLPVLLAVVLVLLSACTGIKPITPIELPTTTRPALTETASPVPATATSTETPTATPTSTATPSGVVNLMAVGDIMLGRTVGDQVLERGPQIVLAGVRSVLETADLLIGNLECALTERDQGEDKAYTLKAPPETAAALAGFDLLSLSNNHAMDFGFSGLLDTQEVLEPFGIVTVGAGATALQARTPVFLERNGLRLAFLAYTSVPKESSGFDTRSWIATDTQPGIAWSDPAQITADVSAARTQADVVIVLLHNGFEVNAYIPPVSQAQQEQAHAAIDAGAALVIGSHPHILQRLERYNGGLIAYSLGNFIFDDWLGVVNNSIILNVTLTRTGVQDYYWLPVIIEKGLPRQATPEEYAVIDSMIDPAVH